jgi:hypothetical protein
LNEGISVLSTEKILTLFKQRKALLNTLKESSTNERGRKVSQVNTQTFVSLKFASKIFQAAFSSDQPKEEFSACIRDLRSDIDFAHFIVTSTFDSLKFVSELPCEKKLTTFARLLMMSIVDKMKTTLRT